MSSQSASEGTFFQEKRSHCPSLSIVLGAGSLYVVSSKMIQMVSRGLTSREFCYKQFGSMPVLEEVKTMVYVTNHNMITMAMVIFKTCKMANNGLERVLTKILVLLSLLFVFSLP